MTVDNHGPGKEDDPRGGLSRRDFVTLSVVAGIAVDHDGLSHLPSGQVFS